MNRLASQIAQLNLALEGGSYDLLGDKREYKLSENMPTVLFLTLHKLLKGLYSPNSESKI